jgi:hypothetical protein
MSLPIKSCRICGNPDLAPILDLGKQTLTGVFPKTKNSEITSGPLELVKCMDGGNSDACGLVQLRHSNDSAEMYGENYGYRSGLNNSMVRHLNDIVSGILNLVTLRENDLILDIGSNDATALKMYPQGKYLFAGIDPTALKFKKYYTDNIRIIPSFFSADVVEKEFGKKKAKVITSISMFYDLEEPIKFVADIHKILADDGVWVFEQSYLPLMLERTAYDTICHEHLEYYGLKQIKWMLDKAGFKIIDVELNDTNGGSFKVTAAKQPFNKPESPEVKKILANEERLSLNTLQPFEKFTKNITAHRDRLIATIKKIKGQNKTILGYGASTKGNVILQYCGLTANEIPYIAEVNEDKFGSFTPGTLIPIVSEREAKAMNPDYFLVLPWHFRENIITREQDFLKAGGQLIFPLPKIEIIGR